MCGRYVMRRDDDEISTLYGAQVIGDPPGPSWNVAPRQQVRVVLERAAGKDSDHDQVDEGDGQPQRQLRTAQWGLVPSWSKDQKIGAKLINARSETITEKPAFRRAAAHRRCLVPADGYYEWEAVDDGKQPYFLHSGNQVLAMAGLYELWPDPTKDADDPTRWLWTMTVLTTTATDAAGEIHDRSPVVLPSDLINDWLNPELTDTGKVRDLLAAVPSPTLQPDPVSRNVNSVRNNGPALLQPVHT